MTPVERQRMLGWIRCLDLDLELAQRVLRQPAGEWPVPPCAVAAVSVETWDGGREVLLPAIGAPDPVTASAPAAVAPVALKGAYARRAARANGS